MNTLLKALILSVLPVSELRGGIPLAVGLKINPFSAFLSCTLLNILIIPFIFLFLDTAHNRFMKIRVYEKLFELYIRRLRRKVEGKTLGFLLLFSFVAVPLPGTGAYTGCILAWFFNMHRKKSILTVALGVLAAGILVTFASVGFFSLV